MSFNEWFSPFDTNRRIGSVINISPAEITVNLSDAGSGEARWYLGDRVGAGEVNEFIFIDCGQTAILGRLVQVWLDGAERLSVDAMTIDNGLNNPVGIIQLLTSINPATGVIYRGIKSHPRLGSQIYSAHPKLISILAEGDSKESEVKLNIAELPYDSAVNITVTPDKLFARHCAVLGATGGGKSYSISRLLQEVQQHGGKALLLDPTGEYSNLDCDTYYVGNHVRANASNSVTFPHWKLPESDIFAFLRPSTQTQMPKLSAAILSQKILCEYWSDIPNLGLNVSADFALVKKGTNKYNYQNAVKLFESNSSGSARWSFNNLSSQIEQECIWPTDKKNDTLFGDCHDGDLGYCISLISRIKSYSSSQHLKWLFDPEKDLKDIPQILESLSKKKGETKILRLDLSAVPFEANGREILVNAIGRKLMDLARCGDIQHNNPLLVFIDEAHQFLNKTIGEETNSINLDAFGNIAKEGRKYGLNVVIATQRPRDIPEDVLSQIGSLIVHRLTNFHDQEVVKRAVGTMDQRSASFLPTLSQGEALLLGIDFPFPMIVKMKKPTIKPTSKSAEYSVAWKRKNIESRMGITDYLEVPDEFTDEFESLDIEYISQEGSTGDMIYSYYFEVSSEASTELLEIMDWKVGQVISDIPVEIFEK
ncbi:ATP-binding protein [Pseudoalteromonas sp. APC 3213]|jgi:hypothetical protein|uniref:ATP-binding protein n=1 Tax=Pseudoalteromonas sp. APC 3213 TaxID=3035178 RepID=UPI00023193BD|nr:MULTISPECIES: ATP-binding protein [unclassified Pseudoalteromonas]MDN3402072.1 ATP-binding protein [Pseudoalteromonas sp. APC 3213]GAA74243.1 hypothetical protein P20480_0703 [Pseudoalteromonas sp. BSi20480]|tara:strand:+ start:1601 stop:3553 length:1953 start_codon:yes stop_codon:yes gene_type:complete